MAVAGPELTHTLRKACGNRYYFTSRLTWVSNATVAYKYFVSRKKAPANRRGFHVLHNYDAKNEA